MNDQEIIDLLENTFGKEQMQQLVHTARKLGVLGAAIAVNSTTDVKAIALQLYEDKHHVLPLDEMEDITEEMLFELRLEGLIKGTSFTQEAIQIHIMHMLSLGS